MTSNVQTVAVPNSQTITHRRRRPVWGAGGLFAQGVTDLVSIPGLKDAVLFAKEGAKALKAPKLNNVQTKKQIHSIEGILDIVDATLASGHNTGPVKCHPTAQRGLEGVESFRRDMKDMKAELEKALSEKYSTKFACQNEIAQFLVQKHDQVSGRISEFCVEGSAQANYAIVMLSEYNQQIQTLSKTVAELEYEIRALRRLLWGGQALTG